VVVPDLSNDVRGAVPRDRLAVDDQLAHGAMVLAEAAGTGSRAGRPGPTHAERRRPTARPLLLRAEPGDSFARWNTRLAGGKASPAD
jgi:hypothetical protein